MIEIRKSMKLLAFSESVLQYSNAVDDCLIELTQKFDALLFYKQTKASNS